MITGMRCPVPPLSLEVNEVSVTTTSGVCGVCVLLPGTTAVSIAEAEASWSCLVCVRASTYTIAAGGWHSYERRDCGRHRLPVVQRPSREHQRPPPPPRQRQQIKSEGRSSAVHLRDIVSPYSTGWGRTAVPEVCGLVGCIDYKAVPDWLDPAE